MKKSIAILVAFAVVVICLTEMCFWTVDDILYQYVVMPVYNAFSAEPITSLADVFRSQYNHYLGHNGRIVAHTIVQIFAGLLGKHIFAICNGFVYCLLVCLIMRMAETSWRNPLALLTTIGLCMLGFIEKYVPSTFVGYFYMQALVVAWLLTFKKAHRGLSIPIVLALLIFSFLAGNSHEAFSIPIFLVLGIYLVLYLREWNALQVVMLCFFALGIIFTALSQPSLNRRMSFSDINYIGLITYVFQSVRCFYFLIATIVVLRIRKIISLRQIFSDRVNLFWLIVIVTLFPLTIFLFGHNDWRQLFCVELASIIIILRVLPHNALPKAVLAILLLGVAVLYAYYIRINNIRATGLNEIVDLYAKSSDGVVFYDINTPQHLPANSISTRLFYQCTFREMNGEVIARHPGAPPITVLPTCCRDLVPETPSQAIMIDNGACVFLNNKQYPASKFYITLTRSIGFYHGAGGRYYVDLKNELFYFDLPTHEVAVVYAPNDPFVIMLSCGVE